MFRIHRACLHDKIEKIKVELQNPDNLDLPDSISKATPIYRAAENGRPDAVKLLLERGANIYLLNNAKQSCLYAAVAKASKEADDNRLKEFYEVFKLIFEYEIELRKKNPKLTETLLLIETPNEDRYTPITRLEKNPELQKKVLEIFVDVAKTKEYPILLTEQNLDGTPIYLAAKNGHPKIVEFLLEVGADIYFLNSAKQSCLFAAVSEANQTISPEKLEDFYNVFKLIFEQEGKLRKNNPEKYRDVSLLIDTANKNDLTPITRLKKILHCKKSSGNF